MAVIFSVTTSSLAFIPPLQWLSGFWKKKGPKACLPHIPSNIINAPLQALCSSLFSWLGFVHLACGFGLIAANSKFLAEEHRIELLTALIESSQAYYCDYYHVDEYGYVLQEVADTLGVQRRPVPASAHNLSVYCLIMRLPCIWHDVSIAVFKRSLRYEWTIAVFGRSNSTDGWLFLGQSWMTPVIANFVQWR